MEERVCCLLLTSPLASPLLSERGKWNQSNLLFFIAMGQYVFDHFPLAGRRGDCLFAANASAQVKGEVNSIRDK